MCLGQREQCNQSRATWLVSQETFISHHPFMYNKLVFGCSLYQDTTTKTPGMTAKIRWKKEHSSEYPGAASGQEMLQYQTSDKLLSGKQPSFCHARVFTAGTMLQQQSLLPGKSCTEPGWGQAAARTLSQLGGISKASEPVVGARALPLPAVG